ncbi:MraY family glycosyltransferase [Herbidospora mongoliensis]|uniref:MraY family glycosyltransferase n=1 Tax=Herbidospora mongoliensis TaxID=688067 RepID=UPI00082FC213|nr:MraY family glycosyltransferase [Herbidospora mongoliensis]
MNPAIMLGTAVSATAVGALAVVPLRRLALRLRLVDHPGGHKAHLAPTPCLGGPAIILGTALPVLGVADDPRIRALLFGGLVFALVGLIDDARPLGRLPRLAVETPTALLVAVNGVRADLTGVLWLDVALTAAWLVVAANAFNLLDNMDGALGTVTMVTGLTLGAAALAAGTGRAALVAFALAGAATGFLVHNWTPARIFMGDCGSLFIGFTVAGTSLLIFEGPAQAPAGALLATFTATVDTGVVLLARALHHRPLTCGGTDHVAHRLRRIGLPVPVIVSVLSASAGVSGVMGVAMTLGMVSPLVALSGAAGAAVVGVLAFQQVDVYRVAVVA